MDESWSRGWRNYVQPWGGLEGKADVGAWGWGVAVPHPSPPWLSEAPSPPLGASSSSWGLSYTPTPLPLTLLTSHDLHLTSAHLGKPGVGGQCKPPPPKGFTNRPLALWGLSGLPFSGPSPGALSKAPFSDLATYRYRSLPAFGEPMGLHSLRATLGSPALTGPPCLAPISQHNNYQKLQPGAGRLAPAPSHPDQEKPALLTLGGPCPVALLPCRTWLACRTTGSPPLALGTRAFYLLRVGVTTGVGWEEGRWW